MYDGHARNGGGPSFDPPKVLANGAVDYPWYMRVREGHTQETAALRRASTRSKPPVIYGSFSCNGIRHFMRNGNFPEASPRTSYVLSTRTTFANEGTAGMLATIDGTLNGRCGSELNSSVQQTSCGFDVRDR